MNDYVTAYRSQKYKDAWAEWWRMNKDTCIAQSKASGQNMLEIANEMYREQLITIPLKAKKQE